MELDELKATWKQLDIKLQNTQLISNKIIVSMIRERSSSRLAKVKRRYLFLLLYLAIWLSVGVAVLAGNPFDYSMQLEFAPIFVYCACLSVLTLFLIKINIDLQNVEVNQDSISISIKKIISIIEKYENPNQFLSKARRLLLVSTTVLFPLSFLPRKIARVGLQAGLIDTLIPILISAILVFVAYKLGAFKERNADRFKEYLTDLNELKGLSEQMN